MSLATSFSMFFLSFAPLWVSILFIDSKSIIEKQTCVMTEKYSILVILIISIISLVILMLSFNKKNADGSQEYTIDDIEEEKLSQPNTFCHTFFPCLPLILLFGIKWFCF